MNSEVETVKLNHWNAQRSSYTCDYCNQSFTLKCNLVSHIRAHIGDKPHGCGVCNESFSTKSGLALHFRTHKDSGVTYRCSSPENHKFFCNYCDKGFSLKSNLILHIRTHTGEKPYRCSYCNKTSATKYNLLAHIKTHYSQKTIKCGYCDKYFSSRKNLHSHVQIHISTKRYYCSYCDKSSIHKGTLRVHERIHTGERPYKCIYCSKSFNHRSNLTHHVRIHTGERPFVCKYCDKAFRQKYALDGHERIHTGARPYSCVDCDKTFAYAASLRSHMKVHDGEQVFTCNYCMRTFNTKVSLSLHIRVHLWNNTRPKKCVNKNDEILLQRALELQSLARMNLLRLDSRIKLNVSQTTVVPLVQSNVDQTAMKADDGNSRVDSMVADPLTKLNVSQVTSAKIDYDNPQVNNVVNVLLPELENELVQDSNDTSTDELKNRLRKQLCKFIDKYSLKNVPSRKVVAQNSPVVPPKPKPWMEFGYVKPRPTLPIRNATTSRQNVSQQSSVPIIAPKDSNDLSLRASAIEEIEKLGLKERISAQLKTIVNSGMMRKERKPDPNSPRSVVVEMPPSRENNLKNQMNNRLQKLFQNNLIKRFDTLAKQKVEKMEKPEVVPVKTEAEGSVWEDHHCPDEITKNLTSELAVISEDALSREQCITEPITEVRIKMETEEIEEGTIIS